LVCLGPYDTDKFPYFYDSAAIFSNSAKSLVSATMFETEGLSRAVGYVRLPAFC